MTAPEVRITDPLATPTGWRLILAYIELTKPRIIELLLVTTVPAMVVAAGGWPGTWLVIATLIGGALSAGGANVINMVADRDIDVIMHRTRRRPLPTARVDVGHAIIFGVVLGVLGFAWLWITSNLLAATVSTAGLLFYVFVYTFYLKRTSVQNIVIGGAAGAVPPLVGWAAVTGSLGLAPWIMFAIIFYWTPPHFWALSLKYKDDYAAAGVPMLPVVVGVERTLDQIYRYSFVLVGVSLMLAVNPALGAVYSVTAVIMGVVLLLGAHRLRTRAEEAMRFFGLTNFYLAILFLAMMIDALF